MTVVIAMIVYVLIALVALIAVVVMMMMMMMHLENNMLESLFLEEKFWEAERS